MYMMTKLHWHESAAMNLRSCIRLQKLCLYNHHYQFKFAVLVWFSIVWNELSSVHSLRLSNSLWSQVDMLGLPTNRHSLHRVTRLNNHQLLMPYMTSRLYVSPSPPVPKILLPSIRSFQVSQLFTLRLWKYWSFSFVVSPSQYHSSASIL